VAEALAALAAPLTEGGLMIEGTSDPLGRLLTFNLYQKFTPAERPSTPTPLRSGGYSARLTPLRSGCSIEESGLKRIGFVFVPSLRADFLPRQFQAVLPKNFIHHAKPGGAIDRFFAAWHAAWQRARTQFGADQRQVFTQAALRLAEYYGYKLDRRPALLRRGFLWLGSEWPKK
jgi:hypothetical protein